MRIIIIEVKRFLITTRSRQSTQVAVTGANPHACASSKEIVSLNRDSSEYDSHAGHQSSMQWMPTLATRTRTLLPLGFVMDAPVRTSGGE